MARYNQPSITKATIEDLVEKKVSEILAARALNQTSTATVPVLNEEVQRRLQELEKKIDETKDDSRAEGLSYILMGKQHQIREEYSSALKMYELAREYFPDNAKLEARIEKVRDKLREHRKPEHSEKEEIMEYITPVERPLNKKPAKSRQVEYKDDENDESNFQEPDAVEDSDYESDGFFKHKSKAPKRRTKTPNTSFDDDGPQTPRSKQLLDIINTRDLSQIRLLKGVGAKKAEGIITALEADEGAILQSLGQLSRLKGVGAKTVENMRAGLTA